MFKILRPGPVPEWVPITANLFEQRPRQYFDVKTWAIAWKWRGLLRIKPIFGGDVFVLEIDGTAYGVDANGLHCSQKPLIPLRRCHALRVCNGGKTVFESPHD